MVLAQYPLQRKAYLGRDWGAATDSSVAIYDCERDTVTRRLPIRYSHYSHKAVYNPRRGKVYIPGEGNYYDTVFAVDCESDSITGRIVVPPEVGTMILATRTDRLYICCGSPTDRVMVVDCASDSVIASIDVGRGPMYPAYDSTNNRIFVGCQDSTIWVLAEDSSGIAEPNGQSPSAIRYSLGGPTLVRARTQLTLPTDSRLYSTNGRLVGRDTPAPGIYWVTSEHDSPRKVVVVP
jgi:DNA-binding beta-propeller fold protein YncE